MEGCKYKISRSKPNQKMGGRKGLRMAWTKCIAECTLAIPGGRGAHHLCTVSSYLTKVTHKAVAIFKKILKIESTKMECSLVRVCTDSVNATLKQDLFRTHLNLSTERVWRGLCFPAVNLHAHPLPTKDTAARIKTKGFVHFQM